ncbi:MAG: hypothetical protein IJH88_09520 [Eggerthellaceae bacterium]|nr:hypothetical protein [Eggerthellaceae bacterium]
MGDGNSTSNDHRHWSGGVAGSLPASFVYIIIALAIGLALVLGFSLYFALSQNVASSSQPTVASALVNSKEADATPAVSKDVSKTAGTSDENGNSDEQIIEEDESPLSSGLGGGEPVSSGGLSFWPIAIIGIVIVALFFFVIMRRMNRNVHDMTSMFK